MRRTLLCLLAVVLGVTLSSCSQDDDPTSPRQAVFEVNGAQGTQFEVVELRSDNAVHHPCLAGVPVFEAPYTFILERAFLDIQGVFQPVNEAERLSNVLLSLGGETVPRRIDDPDETKPIHTGSDPLPIEAGAPPCSASVRGREVRFDVSGTPGILIDATVGDLDGTHIINPFAVPASVYLEDVSEGAFGVFTKISREGDMTVRLFVDDDEKDAGSSEDGSRGDVVVEFEF